MKRFVSVLIAVALLFACASAQTLQTGVKGDEVEKLQHRLYYLGFLSISPDGDYGPKTVEAVAGFQAFFNARGYALRTDGVADEATQALLFDDAVADAVYPLKEGDKNGYVRRAQRRLIDLGFLAGAADGSYGQNTAEAVRAFQQMLLDNGVEDVRATGEADETTLAYLYSELLGFRVDTPKFYNERNPLSLSEGNLYAEAAVLIDAATGETLFAKNAEETMYPGQHDQDHDAAVGAAKWRPGPHCDRALLRGQHSRGFLAHARGPGRAPALSRPPLWADDPLRQRRRNAIATLSAGSVNDFVEQMNAKAQELGLSGTHYVNPHGYHDKEHYTTAADMAALTRYALQDAGFREVFTTHTYALSATDVRAARTLTSSYAIFDEDSQYYYPDAIGGKTGFTSAAGYCFVCAAERGGVELIAVVFKSGSTGADRWTDAARLFEYGFAARGV